MATYAIGDIQGCFDEFSRLLDYIGFSPSRDRLWLVGDLVNRGPASLQVLRFVKGLGERAVVVLGNHDLHLVMQAEGFGKVSHEDTLAEVLASPDRDELVAWLRTRPLFHVEDEYAMVHAGLLPQWSVAMADELSREAGIALVGPDYRNFLANMWGSEPTSWHDGLTGWDRLRIVVNAMTRMRFCTADGVMEFATKDAADAAPPGHMPWFRTQGRRTADVTVVFGHWSQLGLMQ